MKGHILLNVIHIAGTCMIAQGVDGLSRGDLCEGVLAGAQMLFLPLHLSVIQRQPTVLEWVRDWIGDSSLISLEPEDWFERGQGFHGGSHCLCRLWSPHESLDSWLSWTPPPAAADVAIEELMFSRHKGMHLNHVVVIPCLSIQRNLHKVSDLAFKIPAGRQKLLAPHGK